MKFDPQTGNIEFANGLYLYRGMTRKDVMNMKANWEDWNVVNGIPHALRALIKLPNKGISATTILIVRVGFLEHPIGSWVLAPWDLIEGVQNRPEGKYTKRMRAWFEEMFDSKLPVGGDWGIVDATYDPHNQTATILCDYRESFTSDAQWLDYRKRRRF